LERKKEPENKKEKNNELFKAMVSEQDGYVILFHRKNILPE
jgi:hypothetical protein